MTYSIEEECYLELVGTDGYDKAERACNLITDNDVDKERQLFFTAMLNAYWRGKLDGITEARAIIAQKGTQASGKSIN